MQREPVIACLYLLQQAHNRRQDILAWVDHALFISHKEAYRATHNLYFSASTRVHANTHIILLEEDPRLMRKRKLDDNQSATKMGGESGPTGRAILFRRKSNNKIYR
jgi:hypothetical protein